MRITSWYVAESPDQDGARWINEYHIVGKDQYEYRWLCDRRIDPKKEINLRASELVRQIKRS